MKYRKKPVVIEAKQLTDETRDEIIAWVGGECDEPVWDSPEDPKTYLVIKTLEGAMMAYHGDYIIQGVKGEFYPCKADIFELTYEKAE
jgi:hypothetical protein